MLKFLSGFNGFFSRRPTLKEPTSQFSSFDELQTQIETELPAINSGLAELTGAEALTPDTDNLDSIMSELQRSVSK